MNNHTASSLSTKTIIANIATTPSDITTNTNASNNNNHHHVTAVAGQNHLQEATKTISSMILFAFQGGFYIYA